MTEVVAKSKGARISPQKARIVADKVRGLSVELAIDLLAYSNKKAAHIIKKVVESAVANAEHNDALDPDELKIVKIFVDEGSSLKRWRARAKGRSCRIIKRSCHITVVVSD